MENNETKKCCRCKIVLPIIEFGIIRTKRKDGTVRIGKKSKCNKCKNEIQIEYRKKNKERLQIRDAQYHQTVKDKRKQQHIIRYQNPENKQKRRDYIRTYKKERRKNDPAYRLYESLRKRIWQCLTKKSNSSKKYLGCDIDFYKKWIEFTMSDDMTWENYGLLWNIDHVIPIASFDLTIDEEIYKAFNWKNTCARYATENFAKGDKIIENYIIIQKDFLETFIEQQQQTNV